MTYWVHDTDMALFTLIGGPAESAAANEYRATYSPSYLASYSKVEIKRTYFQGLALLRSKVLSSESLHDTFGRIQAVGGRKAIRMLAALFKFVDGPVPSQPWAPLQSRLVTLIDSQLSSVWVSIQQAYDSIADSIKCTRAQESPSHDGRTWNMVIPDCRDSNTNCRVNEFFVSQTDRLRNLQTILNNAPPGELTSELEEIRRIITETIERQAFPWREHACKQVGDLLIGLQAAQGIGVVSSNKKEHKILSDGLGYEYKEFPLASIRRK